MAAVDVLPIMRGPPLAMMGAGSKLGPGLSPDRLTPPDSARQPPRLPARVASPAPPAMPPPLGKTAIASVLRSLPSPGLVAPLSPSSGMLKCPPAPPELSQLQSTDRWRCNPELGSDDRGSPDDRLAPRAPSLGPPRGNRRTCYRASSEGMASPQRLSPETSNHAAARDNQGLLRGDCSTPRDRATQSAAVAVNKQPRSQSARGLPAQRRAHLDIPGKSGSLTERSGHPGGRHVEERSDSRKPGKPRTFAVPPPTSGSAQAPSPSQATDTATGAAQPESAAPPGTSAAQPHQARPSGPRAVAAEWFEDFLRQAQADADEEIYGVSASAVSGTAGVSPSASSNAGVALLEDFRHEREMWQARTQKILDARDLVRPEITQPPPVSLDCRNSEASGMLLGSDDPASDTNLANPVDELYDSSQPDGGLIAAALRSAGVAPGPQAALELAAGVTPAHGSGAPPTPSRQGWVASPQKWAAKQLRRKKERAATASRAGTPLVATPCGSEDAAL